MLSISVILRDHGIGYYLIITWVSPAKVVLTGATRFEALGLGFRVLND